MKRMWIVAACFVASPAIGGMLEDMAELDRSYVPVLALTNQPGRDAESWAAMKRFDAAWRKFRAADAIAREASLAPTLDAAGKQFDAARASIDAGRLKDAHEALEHLRHALAKWRTGRGIAWFPDVLTAYHDEMEHLTDLASRADAGAQVDAALAAARARWRDVEAFRIDPRMHGLEGRRMQELQGLMVRERDALAQLERAHANGDVAGRAQAAKLVRGTFAQMFFLFGEFGGQPIR